MLFCSLFRSLALWRCLLSFFISRRSKGMKVDTGDTALVLISGALVCLMTPGLAFFYGGLVRRKNVLSIMMQSFISMGIVTIIWSLFGFSLAFSGDTWGIIGDFQWFALRGVGFAP